MIHFTQYKSTLKIIKINKKLTKPITNYTLAIKINNNCYRQMGKKIKSCNTKLPNIKVPFNLKPCDFKLF